MIEKTLLLAIIGIIVSATTIYTNPLFQKITNEDILLTLKNSKGFLCSTRINYCCFGSLFVINNQFYFMDIWGNL